MRCAKTFLSNWANYRQLKKFAYCLSKQKFETQMRNLSDMRHVSNTLPYTVVLDGSQKGK